MVELGIGIIRGYYDLILKIICINVKAMCVQCIKAGTARSVSIYYNLIKLYFKIDFDLSFNFETLARFRKTLCKHYNYLIITILI